MAFQAKLEKEFPQKVLGIDFGIDKQLTLSNSIDVREGVMPTRKIKRIHRELSWRKRYGKNWQKTRLKLEREYDKIGNQKKGFRNKLVSSLSRRTRPSRFRTITLQDGRRCGDEEFRLPQSEG